MSDPGGAAETDAVAELASFYRHLADAEFDGYCDLYAHLARCLADDREVLERVVTMAPATKVLPVLLFAAVHALVLGEPDLELAACYRGDPGAPADAWPRFRSFLDERFDDLAGLVERRTIQTNEVGRSAVLLPAFTNVHRAAGRPLTLIELGPSAGLNLFFDRFAIRYSDGVVSGPPASTVQLACEVRGTLTPPRDGVAPPVRSRLGIDLAPVDVTDPDACRWLEACVWPQLTDRAGRLHAAIDLARPAPPDLRAGNALDLLGDVVERSDPDTVVCIYATWVLAYFSHAERAELGAVLDRLGAARDLALVTAEYPSVAPFIDRPERAPEGGEGQAATLVGTSTWIDGRRRSSPVAWCHAHGMWIDWLDPATSDHR